MTEPEPGFRGPLDPTEALAPYPVARGRRRHRWLTAPSGWVLFVCLFLPAVRECNDPIYPVQMPMFWSPYILGMLVAIAALARSATLRAHAIAIIAVLWVTVIGWAVFAAASMLRQMPVGSLLVLAIPTPVLLATRGPFDEIAAARAGAVAGFCSTAWFTLIAFDRGAMIGAYVSCASSLGLMIGCVWWWNEAASG